MTGAEPVTESPTAVQAVADAQETWLSTLVVAPAGLGVAWTDQLLPFQRSARVTVAVPLL